MSKLIVKNLKTLKECAIEIKKFTVLIGDEISGKDDAIRAISGNLLKETSIIINPEDGLFPTSQKEKIESIVKEANRNNSNIVITTNSPYIIATLNNLIYAGEHSRDYPEINKIIEKEKQIRFEDISAYFFKDGTCHSILDQDLKNIDPETIDSVSKEINDAYFAMEDIRYGIKSI